MQPVILKMKALRIYPATSFPLWVIPQLVRHFNFKLDGLLKDEEWKTLNYWLAKQQDFKCRLKLREAGKH
jgi:hypothetical protein